MDIGVSNVVLLSAYQNICGSIEENTTPDASGMEGVSTYIPMSAAPVMTRAGKLYVILTLLTYQ